MVLLEDLAALLGLVFALFGVGLTLITGDGIWDGIGTVLIGLLLVAVAVVLAIETKSLLIGESATERARRRRSRRPSSTATSIERIIHMKTLHLGPEELLVAAKVGVPGAADAADVARGDRRGRAAHPGRGADRPGDLHRARHLPARRLTRDVRAADATRSATTPGGRDTAIAALQGRPAPTAGPEAELWMGAHPAAPSRAGRRAACR